MMMSRHATGLNELQNDFLKVSEHYGKLFNLNRDEFWSLAKLCEEVGELTQAHLRLTGRARTAESTDKLRQSLADEVADVLGQLLIYAKFQNIDLASAVERKWLTYLPK